MRALKICLWIAGIGCLLSLFGMVLPVSSWQSIAKLFGIESVPNLPQFSYAVRVGSGTYAGVGIFFIILALDPLRYGIMVPFSGLGAVFVGVVCAIAGLLTKMAFWWFMGDSLSCLVLGALILVFWKQAKKTPG
ncbi:MAG: hypothetical protein H8D56_26725 [Planctomycetes bacterium]|nr:hypothetical protein [Planctomycetota bacterium]MBL7146145.1 hypothetical protein [Phycisphaerae bacterium]